MAAGRAGQEEISLHGRPPVKPVIVIAGKPSKNSITHKPQRIKEMRLLCPVIIICGIESGKYGMVHQEIPGERPRCAPDKDLPGD
ncbi:hypothetical protein SCFA_220020 [anaerobic digester metagenome]|uniref:Uncharacterized protein n=1 Tax=anaerobic digester metagenome TaxID=1263854 RepID=A0A485M003_9ZZZZ